LLFGRHLVCGSADTALIIPKTELDRAVAVRASAIPRFLSQFMRTMVGADSSPNNLRSLISTLICDDGLRGTAEPASMPFIARRLGISVATARRRLQHEGVTFREVKAEAQDQLARMWLHEKGPTIHTIAERLGFSDTHAFRRAFRRRNGLSPRAYRASSAHGHAAQR
jgi:AraC-like DNA-binding protein